MAIKVHPPKFMWLFVAIIISTAFVSIPLGYLIGTSNVGVGQLTDRQNSFVSGVVQGSIYEEDYKDWSSQSDKVKVTNDVRAFPETRCAAKYYPIDPIGMSGCIQGIMPPQDGKYFIPSPGG